MSENARIYWLLGLFAGAVGLYVWSQTRSGSDFLSGASVSNGDSTSSGGLFQDLTQLPQSVVSTVDRGFRNNNPGNIKPTSDTEFTGQTGRDSDGFGIFSSMEYGIRAIAVIIRNYYRLYGLNTVEGIITRWSATDQAAYVQNVSDTLGVDPYEVVDPTDPNTMSGIVQGIITQENGALLASTVTSTQIVNGIALA